MFLTEQRGIAQEHVKMLTTILLRVFNTVAVRPLVIVDGGDGEGPFHVGEDGQNTGAGAHVEDRLAAHFGFQQVGDHLRGGGVVRRPERHLRFDHDLIVNIGVFRVERGADVAAPVYQNRFIVGFPRGVPVLVLHRRDRVGELHLRELRGLQQILENILLIVFLGNVAEQLALFIPIHETVTSGLRH